VRSAPYFLRTHATTSPANHTSTHRGACRARTLCSAAWATETAIWKAEGCCCLGSAAVDRLPMAWVASVTPSMLLRPRVSSTYWSKAHEKCADIRAMVGISVISCSAFRTLSTAKTHTVVRYTRNSRPRASHEVSPTPSRIPGTTVLCRKSQHTCAPV
jgi:hypothetical protein